MLQWAAELSRLPCPPTMDTGHWTLWGLKAPWREGTLKRLHRHQTPCLLCQGAKGAPTRPPLFAKVKGDFPLLFPIPPFLNPKVKQNKRLSDSVVCSQRWGKLGLGTGRLEELHAVEEMGRGWGGAGQAGHTSEGILFKTPESCLPQGSHPTPTWTWVPILHKLIQRGPSRMHETGVLRATPAQGGGPRSPVPSGPKFLMSQGTVWAAWPPEISIPSTVGEAWGPGPLPQKWSSGCSKCVMPWK